MGRKRSYFFYVFYNTKRVFSLLNSMISAVFTMDRGEMIYFEREMDFRGRFMK